MVWLAVVRQYLVGHLACHLTTKFVIRIVINLSVPVFLLNLSFYFYAALYQQVGEKGNEMENVEYQIKKKADMQKRLDDACSSIHHIEIVSA